MPSIPISDRFSFGMEWDTYLAQDVIAGLQRSLPLLPAEPILQQLCPASLPEQALKGGVQFWGHYPLRGLIFLRHPARSNDGCPHGVGKSLWVEGLADHFGDGEGLPAKVPHLVTRARHAQGFGDPPCSLRPPIPQPIILAPQQTAKPAFQNSSLWALGVSHLSHMDRFRKVSQKIQTIQKSTGNLHCDGQMWELLSLLKPIHLDY
jgi:hypothetical protein